MLLGGAEGWWFTAAWVVRGQTSEVSLMVYTAQLCFVSWVTDGIIVAHAKWGLLGCFWQELRSLWWFPDVYRASSHNLLFKVKWVLPQIWDHVILFLKLLFTWLQSIYLSQRCCITMTFPGLVRIRLYLWHSLSRYCSYLLYVSFTKQFNCSVSTELSETWEPQAWLL